MTILVTGSAGHLGEALMRTLAAAQRAAIGLDILASPFTTHVGSIVDRAFVRRHMAGVRTVLHAATLHKPHVETHRRQDFVDVNITGTLNLLEEAVAAGVRAFVFTSTTSVFGDALIPPAGAPAAWITEDVTPVPKNIYGATKAAAEDLCQLFHRNHGLACLVLRTSRFFPEEDDNRQVRAAYADANVKTNEFLARRVDIEDVVSAHLKAAEQAPAHGFGKYIISATTPFLPEDLVALRTDAPGVLQRRVPAFAQEYARRDWHMFPGLDRVYVNARARAELGWQPRHDFASVIARLRAGEELEGPLARVIGQKGYHAGAFAEARYPVSGSAND
jgi:nucleoside-diphosphate-sugar epimerase